MKIKKSFRVLSIALIFNFLFLNNSFAVLDGEVQPNNKWVVAITFKSGSRVQLCSGVLIQPTTVMSAKHCAFDPKGEKFSKITINAPGSKFTFPHTKNMEVREVTNIIFAEEPENKKNVDEGDVAFYKFDKPFKNYKLPEIGTPAQIATLKPWSLIKGYGYGTSGDGRSKYSPIPSRYELSWGNDDHAVFGNVVTIASVASTACAGDSGGPITAFLKNKKEILIGIASSIANIGVSGCENLNATKMYYMNFNLVNLDLCFYLDVSAVFCLRLDAVDF